MSTTPPDADDREWLLERAAIREFDGGHTRADADRDALLELKLERLRRRAK